MSLWLPSPAVAWDEWAVIDSILVHNPLLRQLRARLDDPLRDRRAALQALLDRRFNRLTHEQTTTETHLVSERTTSTPTQPVSTTQALTPTTHTQTVSNQTVTEKMVSEQALAADDFESARRQVITELAVLRQHVTEKATARTELAAQTAALRQQVSAALVVLRQYETDLATAQEQQRFFKAKSQWLQDRLQQGTEGDLETLWDNSQQLTAATAAVARLERLMESQRRQVALYAGDRRDRLRAYLAGQGDFP